MMNSGSLDYWRNYFRGANADIFGIIDHAIMVAASDCPKEFKLRRGSIAERLFSCRLTRCSGCDRVELAVSASADDGGGCNCKSGSDGNGTKLEFEAGSSKESKVNSCRDDHGEMNMNQVSNYSFEEAEALIDEIEEESQYFEEVLRIRDIVLNFKEESNSELFESLRRLQLMELTMDLLKATEIGKAVNPLRKHGSKDISQLARTLINVWKGMVDEWVKATTPIAEGTPDSVNPSVVDEEEGLPSPPMDEGALFAIATQTGSMDLSKFFDGMDDDGNPQQSGEFIKNQDDRRPCVNSQNIAKPKSKPRVSNEAAVKLNKPKTADSGPGRPPKPTMQKEANIEPKMQQNILKSAVPKKPHVGQLDVRKKSLGAEQPQIQKFKCLDDAALQVKLEATKRKLQERYQQAENAKKQRTIQVIELHDIPKQGSGHRNTHVKPGNHKRQWPHGRK
ncbi:Transcription elongation factor, TFIIS/CRSP70, N-terminal, sub-type [Sesbania bispinosa]|nr:Transcription elongation factor, TFIIS/CRSP70, N-terminal, sub-type [Sesbania bispinosa]